MAKTGAKKTAAKKTAAAKPAKRSATAKTAAATKAVKKTAAAKPAKRSATAKSAKKTTAAKPAKTSATAKPSARDRGVTIDAYLAKIPAPHRAIANRVVAIIRDIARTATSSIKWGQPVFEHAGPMIWMKSFSKHFGLGFWRGAELPDPKGVLEGDGDRMRHIKLRDAADIDESAVRALVIAAIAANEKQGDPTKRR